MEEEDSGNTRERHDTGVVDVNDGVPADTADAVGDSSLVRSVVAREDIFLLQSVWWAVASSSIGSWLVSLPDILVSMGCLLFVVVVAAFIYSLFCGCGGSNRLAFFF